MNGTHYEGRDSDDNRVPKGDYPIHDFICK